MVKLVKPLQPVKASQPIQVTLEGRVKLVKPLQPEKALSPIEVTLEGRVKLVKPLQPEKAPSPNLSLEVNLSPYLSQVYGDPPSTILASDKSNIDSFPSVFPPLKSRPAISRINFKSVPLILPTIFRLVIRYFWFSPILSGKVPASSSLSVICLVNKPSSAARIAVLPSNTNSTVKNRLLKVNVLIFFYLLPLLHNTIII